MPAGADVSVEQLERLADGFLASEHSIVLAAATDDEPGAVFDADGRMVPTVPRERSYSTPELLALERQIIDHALTRTSGAGQPSRGARGGTGDREAADARR